MTQTSQTSPLTQQVLQAYECQKRGENEQAVRLYQEVLNQDPDHFNALHLLGVIQGQTGQAQQALSLLQRAIEIQPHNPQVHHHLGNVWHDLGQHEQALECHAHALRLDPGFIDAHNSLGVSLKALGRLHEAIASYDRALALQPDLALIHINRGNAFQQLKEYEQAIACFDTAIRCNDQDPIPYYNRGNAHLKLKQHQQAMADYDQALRLRPEFLDAWYNRGNACHECQRYDEALQCYARALQLQPDDARVHNNRGNTLLAMQRHQEAIDSYRQATDCVPNYVNAHWNRGYAHLALGDFENGWPLNEWRWQRNDASANQRNFSAPLWLGQQDLRGQTILLYTEQGLGDTLQFCRYVPMVKARGPTVILELPAPLYTLLQHLPGVDVCIPKGQPLPAFDLHCPLLSLPLAFGTRLDTIPMANTPYVSASAEKMREWGDRMGPKTGLRVGWVWSGSLGHSNDSQRSLRLDTLLPHLPIGCEHYCLQKEIRPEDVATLQSSGIRVAARMLHDFSDTAALCAHMDLVVSVDTSVAHLAAAMGRPTWVLVPFESDWRWLLNRDDSPWYRSVRLFRQDDSRQWAPVLQRVKQALYPLGTQALAQLDNPVAAFLRRAYAHKERMELPQAVADFDRAIALQPDLAEAHSNKALVLLTLGDFENGWRLHEWRWKKTGFTSPVRPYTQPLWLGQTPLAGKTILLHQEQGLGDTLQFCRYIPWVKARGATVIVEVLPELIPLMQAMPEVSAVISWGTPPPPFDLHCPFLSLPLAFGTRLDTIPFSDQPYLFPHPQLVREWALRLGIPSPDHQRVGIPTQDHQRVGTAGVRESAQRLGLANPDHQRVSTGGEQERSQRMDTRTLPRVGLVWRSASPYKADHKRSMRWSDFVMGLPTTGFEYHCLQKELDPLERQAVLRRGDVRVWDQQLTDLSQTAALCAHLDLVITTCTSVAHLAGAMGKPVWILLCYAHDWRWFLHRDDSPWYPHVTLFRQTAPGQWDPLLQRVHQALSTHTLSPAIESR